MQLISWRVFFFVLAIGVFVACLPLWGNSRGRKIASGNPSEYGDLKEDFSDLLGRPAPELVAKAGISGEAIKLSDLRGKVVLLDFWAVDCDPCIRSFPELRELHEKYHDKGLEIVGVTMYLRNLGFDKDKGELFFVGERHVNEDTGRVSVTGGLDEAQENDMLRDFVDFHHLKHRVVTLSNDGWRKAVHDFNVLGTPTTVIIDRQGIVQMAFTGHSPESVEKTPIEIRKLIAQ